MTQELPEQSVIERWWIHEPSGKRREDLGPFLSRDQAIRIRSYVESVEKRDDLSIHREGSRS